MTRRAMIDDGAVARALSVIEASGMADWLDERIRARHARPGRPRMLSVSALLTALLVLGLDDRALHLTGATEVLFCRLSDEAKASLGVRGDAHDARSFAARYRQVRYLFHALAAVLDPSGLPKNHRLGAEAFERRCREMSESETRDARTRLEFFMGALLAASAEQCERPRPPLAYGLDATPVPLFSRGPSKRNGLCATDPDGGWYVREGDHREREDHKGRATSRVAWALEATLLTSAPATPGALPSFPNLVVGLALDRPGVNPGATAARVLAGARERGFAPGPLGVDRAYSSALATSFHLPARAMGYRPVMDYRVDELGRQANSHGAVLVEGTWYCPGMPEVLVAATLDLRNGRVDDETYRARIAARADYALRRKSGPDADGYERFSCPALGHPKVRCALRPTSLLAFGGRPVTPPLQPPLLCTQSAITIAPDVAARHAQSLAYGSEEWARHYATLRNTIEGWNGFAKDPAHEALAQPARRRVRGIAAQGIFVTLLLVAANLRKIDAHHQQMANRDAVEARKRARRRRVSLKDYVAN